MTPIAATTVAPRVAENLNHALHRLFDREERLYLLGEDLLDPYGGAFKITKGLSSRFGDRVVATPLSEGGILGVAGGLALCGNEVIVEVMFGDFLALGFDQVLNFASKSVSMYGRRVPIPLVVRCPVGGNRGYGPTHSQSPQKHFVGIPNLALYELSPFHDAEAVLHTALQRGAPAILFEDKVLYTRRMYQENRVDDAYRYRITGSGLGWAHAFPDGEEDSADFVVVAPGGVTHRALDAARALREAHGRSVHVVTPAQLHPLDIEPVLPLLASAGRVAVVEEGTAGGTWGSEVAQVVHERIWSSLSGPVLSLSSADSIIPTAGHLEREVLLGAEDIRDGIRRAAGWGDALRETAQPGPTQAQAAAVETAAAGTTTPVTVPKLNNNDETYLVADWLVDEDAWVEPDTEVVALDTSKAQADIAASGSGYLRRVAAVGDELAVGDILGHLLPERAPRAAPEQDRPARPTRSAAPDRPVEPIRPLTEDAPQEDLAAEVHRLDRAQQGTAAVVAKSHREVPAGFTLVKAQVDDVLDRLDRLSDEGGAVLGLAEVVVKAVADAQRDFPRFFGSLVDDRTVALADAPHVGVTVDVDGSLYVPVVTRAHERSLAEIADTLMDFRMKALGKEFTAHELTGGNIAVSLNPDPGVVLVQPLVLWPQLCMVSVGAVGDECRIDEAGVARTRRFVHIGLAYDHRVVNGRDAVLFLTRIKAALEEPAQLGGELTWTTA
ncbi:2-oxo acid dehydrogenase subunit E2 [Streptomyces griseus]|uniref:2-oxo acid dehydrogenase subunit E2 n=1 Tax=Streptomyces griseus TaxID=1911 RepID=UPI0007C7AEC6|nr:2-oxo acid dehydrogenase subunit E2 [Streptomyces griseus]